MMRDFLENVEVVIVGSLIVVGMTVLYWVARLFGIHLEDDF